MFTELHTQTERVSVHGHARLRGEGIRTQEMKQHGGRCNASADLSLTHGKALDVGKESKSPASLSFRSHMAHTYVHYAGSTLTVAFRISYRLVKCLLSLSVHTATERNTACCCCCCCSCDNFGSFDEWRNMRLANHAQFLCPHAVLGR